MTKKVSAIKKLLYILNKRNLAFKFMSLFVKSVEHFMLQHFECGPGYRCVRRQCQPRSRKFWARNITVVCLSSNSTNVGEDTA